MSARLSLHLEVLRRMRRDMADAIEAATTELCAARDALVEMGDAHPPLSKKTAIDDWIAADVRLIAQSEKVMDLANTIRKKQEVLKLVEARETAVRTFLEEQC